MSQKLFLFLAQAILILALTAFHIWGARLLMHRIGLHRRMLRRVIVGILAALVLLLDLPLIHLFIFYKIYHPVLLDQLMHDWAGFFVALHANAILFGSLLFLDRYLIRIIRQKLKRKGVDRPAVPSAQLSPVEPVGAIALETSPADILPPRRKFLYTAGLAVAGYVTSSSTMRAMGATDDYRMEQAVVKIPNLPEKLKGTRIAIISDIHSSVFMTREDMERYVDVLNGMNADMTFVLGDFVNSKLREVYPFAEAFTGLKAPLGVYGVTGNHDYYTGEIETVAKEVEQCGIKLLRNDNVVIEKDGEKLWLLGMDDGDIYDVKPYLQNGRSEKGTIENMLRGIPENAPKIFLCHKPYPFEEYSSLGVDLMLSGHTHGGQIVIAQLDNINLSFATLASRYVAGLYRARSNRKSQLYITRGIGTVGLPVRINCPPEVTQLVLV